MKILCVDDDPSILMVLDAALSMVGSHEVETAESGDAALADYILKGTQFDCLLLDIQMPGMSGIELCRRIREQHQYDHVPIIMLTAMTDQSYIDDAFQLGATDYVAKPFDPVDLNTRVKTIVARFGDSLPTRQKKDSKQTKALEKRSSNKEPETVAAHDFELDHPFDLHNTNGVLAHLTFENYLEKMSPAGKKEICIFAVGIQNISKVYNSSDGYMLESLLREIASFISNFLRSHGAMISYFGNGIFCVTIREKNVKIAGDLPPKFEHALESMESMDGFLPILIKHDVKLVTGPVNSPSMFKGQITRLRNVIKKMKIQLK